MSGSGTAPTSVTAQLPPPAPPPGQASNPASHGVPSQAQSNLPIRVVPGPHVIPDNEIEQIWYLRRRGVPCPVLGGRKRSELHIVAEGFWKEKAAEAVQRLDAYSVNLAASNNELYQLIGFYSVLQGVLLTASAQSNLLCCSNWWIPVTLCALSTLCTCVGIYLKLLDVREFRYQRDLFNAQHKHRQSQLTNLRQYRGDFDFSGGTSDAPLKAEHFSVLEILIFFAVVVFSFIIGFGSWKILCNPGTPCK